MAPYYKLSCNYCNNYSIIITINIVTAVVRVFSVAAPAFWNFLADYQWRSEGIAGMGAGRTGRYLLGAADGRKLYFKNHVKILIMTLSECELQ